MLQWIHALLTTWTISEGVTEISQQDMPKVTTKVEIPGSAKSIVFSAFIGCKKTDLTNTNELAKEVLNIPFHSELVDEDIKKITNCLN